MEEVSGMLQNCVAILKLCHILTENMSKISLNQINPQINEIICQSTTRVVPRFDALLRSMAGKNVDIRVIEARVAALVSACWSLVVPFYLINPQYKEHLGGIVREMEIHHSFLQFALEQADNDLKAILSTNHNSSTLETSSTQSQQHPAQNPTILNNDTNNQASSIDSSKITAIPMENLTQQSNKLMNCNGSLRHSDKKFLEESKDLLNNDEAAPADPLIS